MWLLSPWNMASVDWGNEIYFFNTVTNLNVNLHSHVWLVAVILASRSRHSVKYNFPPDLDLISRRGTYLLELSCNPVSSGPNALPAASSIVWAGSLGVISLHPKELLSFTDNQWEYPFLCCHFPFKWKMDSSRVLNDVLGKEFFSWEPVLTIARNPDSQITLEASSQECPPVSRSINS